MASYFEIENDLWRRYLTVLILAKYNKEMMDSRFAYSNCKNTENVFITYSALANYFQRYTTN